MLNQLMRTGIRVPAGVECPQGLRAVLAPPDNASGNPGSFLHALNVVQEGATHVCSTLFGGSQAFHFHG